MIYRFNQCTLDTERYQFSLRDKPVSVEPLVFDLLVYLVENRDRVVSREELLDNLWEGKVVTDSALGARLKDARKAVQDSGSKQEVIKTSHGRGYQFVAKVYESRVDKKPASNQSDIGISTSNRPEQLGPSVVVLPFDILDKAQDQHYLALGIAENIINALTQFRELFVIGIRSAQAAKQRSLAIDQLGSELGVQYVVTGGVHLIGDRLRVTTQLLDATNDRQVWAEKYDREIRDIFSIQDEIANLIVGTIVGHIEDISRKSSAHKHISDMQAYDHVLRGRECLSHYTRDGTLEAREHFNNALNLDSDFPPARAGLARSYMWEYWSDWASDPQNALTCAMEHASKAVILDGSNHEVHKTLSMCYLNRRQYDLALVHIDKCIALNPNDYGGFCDKSWILALSGNPEGGVKCSTEGLRRNPFSRGMCLMNAGIAHYSARRYREAIRDFSETMSFQLWRLAGLAASYGQLGESENARQVADELLSYARLELAVDLGNNKKRWLDYWRRVFPFKHEEEFEHLLEGIRKAGLPA